MKKKSLIGIVALLTIFSVILVSAGIFPVSYNENFLTNNTYTILNTPDNVTALFTYNDTWLNFDGVDDFLYLLSPARDLVKFEWNGSGSWATQRGIDAYPNTYPVYHNGSGYIFGAYNSTTNYSGGIDEINLYDYSVPPLMDGVINYSATFDGSTSYFINTTPIGLGLNDNITMGGWFKPTGVLPSAFTALMRVDAGEYQLFSADTSSRGFFGDGAGWDTTRPGLLGTQPERWVFFMAIYDDASTDITYYANRYPQRIYSIGDSITAGHGGGALAHCTEWDNCAFSQGTKLSHTYQYWLDYYMGSFASAESATTTFYNKGWGSQTCDAMIARWDNSSSGLVNDSIIMVNCGINDGMTNSAEIKADYDQIVALADARNQTLYWGEVLPTTTGCGGGDYVSNMTDVNNYLESLGTTYDFINVIHWHNNLTNGTYGCANTSLFEDSAHPNQAGYEIMGKQMWQEGFGGVDYTQTVQQQEIDTYGGGFNGIEGASSENLTIGRSNPTANYWYTGEMNNIMILNNSINSTDITDIFNNGRFGTNSNQYIVSSWFLNNTGNDYVGTNDLTNTAVTYTQEGTAGGTVAYFSFDGTYNDTSENAYNDTTVSGGATVNVSEQGYYNQGLSLDGSSDSWLNLTGMDSSVAVEGTDFTISTWVYIDTFGGQVVNFIFGNDFGSGGYAFGVRSLNTTTGRISLWVDGTSNAANSENNLQVGQWHHITATSDQSGTYTFYIDGQPAGTDTSQTISAGGGNNYLIGADPRDGDPYHFDGMIDDLLIENYARNSSQILDLYENGLFEHTDRLKLNENGGTVAYDIQNLSKNATINGAKWSNDAVQNILTLNTNYSVSSSTLTLLDHTYDWDYLDLTYTIDTEWNTVGGGTNLERGFKSPYADSLICSGIDDFVFEHTFNGVVTYTDNEFADLRNRMNIILGGGISEIELKEWIENYDFVCLDAKTLCDYTYYFIIENLEEGNVLSYSDADVDNLITSLLNEKNIKVTKKSIIDYYITNYTAVCEGVNDLKLPEEEIDIKKIDVNSDDPNMCNIDVNNTLAQWYIPLPTINIAFNNCDTVEFWKYFFNYKYSGDYTFTINGLRIWWLGAIFILVILILVFKRIAKANKILDKKLRE